MRLVARCSLLVAGYLLFNWKDLLKTPAAYLSPLEKLPPAVRQAILRLPDRYQQFVGLILLDVSEAHIRDILQIKTSANFRSLKSRVFAKLSIEVQKPMEREEDDKTK